MPSNNTTVLAAAYLEASTDFQQRVPDPTQHSVAQVSKFLFSPMNRKYLNEFMDIFVNRIAGQLVHQRVFTNPLKRRREDILYGTTIQEIALGFVKAHAFKDDWGHRVDDLTNLLKVYRPDGTVAYHSVNRYDQYPISINRTELRGAFTDEYGLNNLAAAIMQVPYNAAEYDEYQIYKQLIAEHEANHGFYKHQLASAPMDEATGKAFLTAIQIYADKIQIPTALYNAGDVDVPVWSNADESDQLVLYITPEAKASLNVNTLAGLFNVDLADIKYRIQVIDNIPVPGAVALLTTSDFFVCADYDISNTSFFNPQTMTENFYYTVIGMYSTSPFVPAILFTTEAGTVVPTVTQAVTSLTQTAGTPLVLADGDVVVPVSLNLVGTLTGSDGYTVPNALAVAPDSALFELTATTGSGATATAYELDPAKVYVDRFGQVHIDAETAAVEDITITLASTSTYLNPDGTTSTYQASGTVYSG